MTLLNSLILGIIQGVAEFLPISSSGHLSIAQNLLGLGVEGTDDVFFDVLLHLGTLGAVFVAYWQDIKEMILEFFRTIGDLAVFPEMFCARVKKKNAFSNRTHFNLQIIWKPGYPAPPRW